MAIETRCDIISEVRWFRGERVRSLEISSTELVLSIISGLSLMVWLYLWLFHGGFWRADQRLEAIDLPENPPAVTVIIPARDEADVIAESLTSLLHQDYPGALSIFLVDDNSSDDTATIGKKTAANAGMSDSVTIIPGAPLPPSWTGKMWAVQQGLDAATSNNQGSEYILLTDADIRHAKTNLRQLVAKAKSDRLDLVSLMVKLKCVSVWDWLLIPAFVFFFQKLFPFPVVNEPDSRLAAAAGGCMLVRRTALEKIGGVISLKSAIIDDCALARALKTDGPIWLGLSTETESIRAYNRLGSIWQMVARSAFEQLNNSFIILCGTVIGMVLIYLAPPAIMQLSLLWDATIPMLVAGAAWALMAFLSAPTFKLYELSPVYGLLLPIAGLLYLLMTIDSARRYWLKKGGAWKGRTYG